MEVSYRIIVGTLVGSSTKVATFSGLSIPVEVPYTSTSCANTSPENWPKVDDETYPENSFLTSYNDGVAMSITGPRFEVNGEVCDFYRGGLFF
jgi:hypothetical protein